MDPILRTLGSGLITRGAISEKNRPPDSVEESINFDFDTIGAARTRLGTTMLGPSLNTVTSSDVGMVYGTQYGKFNQGAGFLQNPAAIDFGSYTLPTIFSYSVWFKTTQTGGADDHALVNFTGNYILAIDKTTHQLKFISDTNIATGGPAVNDNIYHHAVLTFDTDGGLGVLYLDGVPINTFSGFFSTSGSSDLLVGAISPSGGSQQYIGDLDDFAIFERQLNYLDVQTLFASELVNTYLISDATLLDYWQFEGNSNTNLAPIIGLHYYVDILTGGINTHLIAVVGTQAWIWVDGITFSFWSSVRTSLTQGSRARFATYLNYVFMVNGTEDTEVWDGVFGDSFSSEGNALNAPRGKFIENFKGRMWIAGNDANPDFLYYSTGLNINGLGTISTTSTSGSVSGSNTQFTSLSIGDTITANGETRTISAIASDTSLTTDHWTNSNSGVTYTTTPIILWELNGALQYIPVNSIDGEQITALQRFRSEMIVFKTNHIYRVFDINQVDPAPWYPVGTFSQESVVETKVGIFFHHSSGFYQYNIYDMVQEISRPIIDIVKAIPASSYSSITGWLEPDGDHICWSIGNVTVQAGNQTAGAAGVFFKNLVVRYTISTQTWTHRTYPTQVVSALRRAPLFNDGNFQYPMIGDTAGNVLKPNTGLTDNGAPITYSLIHAWEMCDGMLSTRKTAMTGNFNHYGGTGSQVSYQTDEQDPDNLGDWSNGVGVLAQKNTGFNTMNIKARKFRFKISGESVGEQFFYYGYELWEVLREFLQFSNKN